jgi:hypothetical protein
VHSSKVYRAVEVWLHSFLTYELDYGEWSASRPGHFTPSTIAPSNHKIVAWVGLGPVWTFWGR